jgi:hypothetical protein
MIFSDGISLALVFIFFKERWIAMGERSDAGLRTAMSGDLMSRAKRSNRILNIDWMPSTQVSFEMM